MWKGIHKKALTEDKKKVSKDLKNGTAYDYFSNVAMTLMKSLKPMFITKLTFKSRVSYFLDVLPSNSDSKTVCNYIYLSLALNQLQHLIVKRILNNAIGNKGKIYLKSNQQLLIYGRGKCGVKKSKVVKAIEISFALLGRRNKLVISMLTDSAQIKLAEIRYILL